MKPNTVNAHHDTDPPLAAVPPELLETVARALAAALIPPPRRPPPPETEQAADFLTAAQLARRLGISRETVRRLAIAGTLPHTVVCHGARKTTRRYPRRFAEEFVASGLEVADLAAFAAAWRARVTASAKLRPACRVTAPCPRRRALPRGGVSWLRAAALTWGCSFPSVASRLSPRGGSARRARSGSRAWTTPSPTGSPTGSGAG